MNSNLTLNVSGSGQNQSIGIGASPSDVNLTGNLELGELGQLTITNDNESSYDVSINIVLAPL